MPDRVRRALDAGSGTGEYTRLMLLPRAGKVVALDTGGKAAFHLGEMDISVAGGLHMVRDLGRESSFTGARGCESGSRGTVFYAGISSWPMISRMS